ncbi:MAG: hypothetical protein AABZ30_03600 [Myxococcota bacterium]
MNGRAATVAALVLYLGALVGVGLWSRRRTHGFRDYATGGGAIPAWMLAISFMANFISSNSFVGHSAKSYETGLVWCLVGAIMVVCCAVSWSFFAPRFAAFAREHDATTLPDFFEKRFGSPPLAAVVNWIVVAATLFYVLAVLRGTALVMASALGVSYAWALVILYAVTVVYCLLGGLWADVSTDVVQAALLVVGALLLFYAVAAAPADVSANPPPLRPAPLGLVLAVGLGGGVKLLADPKQVMVFYAFRDEAAARRFRAAAPIMLLVVYACLFPVGFMARRLAVDGSDLEKLVPSLVFDRQILGPWFGIVFLITLLAASMSSLDSALLVMATCLEKHVLAPMAGGEPSVGRARVALLGIATLALALSLRPIGGIIALTTFAGALIGAALLPAICVGLTKATVPTRAVAVSVVVGAAGAVVGRVAPDLLGVRSPWVQDVFVGLAASTLALVPSLVRRRAVVSSA